MVILYDILPFSDLIGWRILLNHNPQSSSYCQPTNTPQIKVLLFQRWVCFKGWLVGDYDLCVILRNIPNFFINFFYEYAILLLRRVADQGFHDMFRYRQLGITENYTLILCILFGEIDFCIHEKQVGETFLDFSFITTYLKCEVSHAYYYPFSLIRSNQAPLRSHKMKKYWSEYHKIIKRKRNTQLEKNQYLVSQIIFRLLFYKEK